jgi:hypothetical protein
MPPLRFVYLCLLSWRGLRNRLGYCSESLPKFGHARALTISTDPEISERWLLKSGWHVNVRSTAQRKTNNDELQRRERP